MGTANAAPHAAVDPAGRVSPARPLVTVVVPVRDDPGGVRDVVAHLERQTLGRDRFEIVIGDDGSAARLAPVATDLLVRVAAGPPRTSYAARNRAAGLAAADVLAFCDSDCLPDPGWLEAGLAALEDADLVAGEVAFVPPDRPTVWSLLTADMFLDQRRNVVLDRGVTANLFVRRDLFRDLGGFDPSLPSGGDYDFVGRAVERGARLRFAPGAVVRHPTIDTRRAFLRKVWVTNYWSAVRLARAGEPPDVVGAVTAFVPVVGVARARRKALRPALRLERPRLEAAGIGASKWQHARALLALYLLVAYVAGVARTRGWRRGKRLVR